MRFVFSYGDQTVFRDVPPSGQVTVPEMAALLGITRVAAYAYIKNGLIPVFLLAGRKNLIRLSDVVEFRRRRQQGDFNYRRLFPFGDE